MSIESVKNPGRPAAAGAGLAADGSSNSCHNGGSESVAHASEVLAQLAAALPRLQSESPSKYDAPLHGVGAPTGVK
jgi:hypothetical protein